MIASPDPPWSLTTWSTVCGSRSPSRSSPTSLRVTLTRSDRRPSNSAFFLKRKLLVEEPGTCGKVSSWQGLRYRSRHHSIGGPSPQRRCGEGAVPIATPSSPPMTPWWSRPLSRLPDVPHLPDTAVVFARGPRLFLVEILPVAKMLSAVAFGTRKSPTGLLSYPPGKSSAIVAILQHQSPILVPR